MPFLIRHNRGKGEVRRSRLPGQQQKRQVAAEIDKMDIPLPTEYMTWCGSVVNKFKLGFSGGDADTGCRESRHRTYLACHQWQQKQDQLTPYYMGRDIYEAIDSKDKKILSVMTATTHRSGLTTGSSIEKTMI